MISGFETYLNDQDLSSNTVRSYLRAVSGFSRWFSGTNGYNLRSETITAQDIKEFRQFLQIRGQKPATVNLKLAAIRALCDFWGVDPGTIKGIGDQRTAPKWLDKRDQGRLIKQIQLQENGSITAAARHKAMRDKTIVMVLLNTGLRVSELCNLTVEDLNINPRSGTLEVKAAKGNKNRTIPLNLAARTALTDWISFTDIKAGPAFQVTERTVQRILSDLARKSNIDCTPHTLRHTFAHNLISAGVSLDQVATILGHDSLDTTRIYTQPGLQDLSNAVSLLD